MEVLCAEIQSRSFPGGFSAALPYLFASPFSLSLSRYLSLSLSLSLSVSLMILQCRSLQATVAGPWAPHGPRALPLVCVEHVVGRALLPVQQDLGINRRQNIMGR